MKVINVFLYNFYVFNNIKLQKNVLKPNNSLQYTLNNRMNAPHSFKLPATCHSNCKLNSYLTCDKTGM